MTGEGSMLEIIDYLIQLGAGLISLVLGLFNLKSPSGPFEKRKWLAPSLVGGGILLIVISALQIYFRPQ